MIDKTISEILEICVAALKEFDQMKHYFLIGGSMREEEIKQKSDFVEIVRQLYLDSPADAFRKLSEFYNKNKESNSHLNECLKKALTKIAPSENLANEQPLLREANKI